MTGPSWVRTCIYTASALIAFATNSLICRSALGNSTIDPAGFTIIRLASGVVVLWAAARIFKKKVDAPSSGSWGSAAMLFLYAITFSFAYMSLSVGTGSLILFGSVQTTMILAGLWYGERPRVFEWLGLIIALFGLIYLVLPGLESPPLSGVFLMTAAGISWGVYSLRGRGVNNPVAVNGDNFLRSIPFVLASVLLFLPSLKVSKEGIVWAILSGGVATATGYVLWYSAIRNLNVTRAASVQLFVPLIAAAGAVLFLSESITFRLIISALMIVGGIGSHLFVRNRQIDQAEIHPNSYRRSNGDKMPKKIQGEGKCLNLEKSWRSSNAELNCLPEPKNAFPVTE